MTLGIVAAGRGLGIPFCGQRPRVGSSVQAADDPPAHHRHALRVRLFVAGSSSRPDASQGEQLFQLVRDIAVVVHCKHDRGWFAVLFCV